MIQDIEPVCIAEQNFCSQFFHLPKVDDEEQQLGESTNEEQVNFGSEMIPYYYYWCCCG